MTEGGFTERVAGALSAACLKASAASPEKAFNVKYFTRRFNNDTTVL